ncbi:hypothetical protein MMC07_009322 [Pseudocyphellaria aurata]|nr:hypothetical protein [Pseudocyphellaria aurata]
MIDLRIPIRAVQFFCALVSLGLNGYVAHWYNKYSFYDDSISEVNFLIFVSLWTGLITIYLAITQFKFPHLAPAIAVLVLDALTMLFWFSGFIALAVYHSNLGECRGRVCDDLVAAIVFGAFEWVLFAATTVLGALAIFRGNGSKSSGPTTAV